MAKTIIDLDEKEIKFAINKFINDKKSLEFDIDKNIVKNKFDDYKKSLSKNTTTKFKECIVNKCPILLEYNYSKELGKYLFTTAIFAKKYETVLLVSANILYSKYIDKA